jgi:mannosyltransferase OCH1-like enzyme/predicted Zn-dependent protease
MPEAVADDPAVVPEHARILQLSGDVDGAVDRLLRAFEKTGNIRICQALVQMEIERGDDAAADAHIRSLPDETGATRIWFVNAVRVAERLGHHEEALERCERAIACLPSNAVFKSNRWRALVRLGRSAEAEQDCLVEATEDSADVDTKLAAARFLAAIGKASASADIFLKLAASEPTSPQIARVWATVLLEKAEAQEAKAVLSRLKPEAHDDPEIARLLARVDWALGDFDCAQQRRSRLVNRFPDNSILQMDLVRGMLALGQLSDALDLLESIPDEPSSTRLQKLLLRSEAEFNEGRYSESLSLVDEVLAIESGHVAALRRKSDCLLFLGDLEHSWQEHANATRARASRDLSGRTGWKLRNSSLAGRILNEFRLLSTPEILAGCAEDVDQRQLLTKLKPLQESDPGNTSISLSMMGALKRSEQITDHPCSSALEGREHRIPKRLTQYWDTSEPPKQVVWLMDLARDMNPDYDYCRFNDSEARQFLRDMEEPAVFRAFQIGHKPAVKADILRLAVLWHEGGVYLDADDRCLHPLDSVVDQRLRFIGYQEAPRNIGNNFLAVEPGNPIIRAALEDAVFAFEKSLGEVAWLGTGPGALTRAFARFATTQDGSLAPDIWIMPESRLRHFIAPHIRMSYKFGHTHWQSEFNMLSKG